MRRLHLLILPLLTALSISLSGPILADTHAERHYDAARAETSGSDHSTETAVTEPAQDFVQHDFVQQVIELTNRERLRAGLPALKRQKNLQESAGWMARDMSEHSYLDHRDSGRREMPTRLTDFKYGGYHSIGENIAMGPRSPEEVVDCWMNSPGHRANILSTQYAEIGVGYVPPSTHNAYGYWVQDFGARFDSSAVVIDNDVARTKSSRIKLSVHGQEWVEEMRLSNDGLNWTTWEDFRPLRDWSLESGSGKRTVYIEVRRAARVERLEAAVQVDGPGAPNVRIAAGTRGR